MPGVTVGAAAGATTAGAAAAAGTVVGIVAAGVVTLAGFLHPSTARNAAKPLTAAPPAGCTSKCR